MLKNYLSLIGSMGVGRVVSFIWVIYLARYLGVEDYGRYGTVMAVIGLCTIWIDFGAAFIVIKETAADKSRAPHYLALQICQRLLMCFVVILGLIIGLQFVDSARGKTMLFFLATSHMIFHNLALIGDSVLTSHHKQYMIAMLNTLHTVGWAVLGALALHNHLGLPGLFAAMCLNSALFLTLYSCIIYRNFVRPHWNIRMRHVIELMKAAWPIGMTGVFGVFIERSDRVLLTFFHGAHATGLYNAAATLVYPLADLSWSSAIVVLYPMLAILIKNEPVFTTVVRNTLTLLWGMCLAIVIGVWLFATPMIHLLLGQKYHDSIPLLMATSLILLAIPFHGLMGRILILRNRQVAYFRVYAIIVAINLALNLLLIFRWKAYGAAAALVTTQFALPIVFWIVGKISLRPYLDFYAIACFIFSGAAAALAALLTSRAPLAVRVFVYLFVFGALSETLVHIRRLLEETRLLVAKTR